MEKICVHAYVSGLVQGVFFRSETCEKAKRLGLMGWVKNLSDGRVEVMLYGKKEKIAEMQDWLWEGPERAKVVLVETRIEEKPNEIFNGFEVR